MISEAVAERARELLDQHRVLVIASDPPGAIVLGNSVYQVWADQEGIRCDCYAGCDTTEPSCCHAVAAMVAWAESGG